jgi:hypothetical protein
VRGARVAARTALRNLVVRQATRMKNRIAGLLLETGTLYNKERLHGKA